MILMNKNGMQDIHYFLLIKLKTDNIYPLIVLTKSIVHIFISNINYVVLD